MPGAYKYLPMNRYAVMGNNNPVMGVGAAVLTLALHDTFLEASTTPLQNHTPDTVDPGNAWTSQAGATAQVNALDYAEHLAPTSGGSFTIDCNASIQRIEASIRNVFATTRNVSVFISYLDANNWARAQFHSTNTTTIEIRAQVNDAGSITNGTTQSFSANLQVFQDIVATLDAAGNMEVWEASDDTSKATNTAPSQILTVAARSLTGLGGGTRPLQANYDELKAFT